MKLVLTQDVAHVGRKGEQVAVANGYGINYLIPSKKGLKVDSPEGQSFLKRFELLKGSKAAMAEANAEELSKLVGEQLSLSVEANDEGGLFGSLTAIKIAQMITALTQVQVEANNVVLSDGPIKEIGEYSVGLQVGDNQLGEVMLNVTTTI